MGEVALGDLPGLAGAIQAFEPHRLGQHRLEPLGEQHLSWDRSRIAPGRIVAGHADERRIDPRFR